MSAGQLRIGVVGAGIMGRGNARVLAAQPDVQIVAVSSRTLSSSQELVDSLAAGAPPEIIEDPSQLLSDPRIDAVVLTTPDHLHADMMVAAAEAGKHILVEKPLTTSVVEADRAVAAIRRSGVIAMCLFNHRWVPAYAQAKELVADLGPAVVGYARKNDTIYVPTTMLSWADRTTCAWFLSSHDIDLMTWLIGDEITEVVATARRGLLSSRGIDTPDAIQIQARFAGGAVATFESAWIYPNTFPTMVDSYATLACERGVVQLDRQRENVVLATEEALSYPRNMLQRKVHGVEAGAYRDAIRHFVDCCLTKTPPLVTIESSRHVTAVLEAAHRSISSGSVEQVAAAPASAP